MRVYQEIRTDGKERQDQFVGAVIGTLVAIVIAYAVTQRLVELFFQ